MRCAAALLVISSLAAAEQFDPRFLRFTSRTEQGRSDRGLDSTPYAFFELAPSTGAGMGAACACSAITGANGEAITVTRGGNGTCTKTGGAGGGVAVTGIANGDLVVCATNQARTEFGDNGLLGILSEDSRTNTCIRSAELCNVAWADVGTPACATDQATGPLGTATMDSITDDDALALEGRSQAITTTSATQHTVSCYVKSSTATRASITLVGTGSSTGDCTGTATGLSTTTSTRVTCTSPAAYAGTLTSVTLTIRVGTVVGDTGVLFVEGCQHEVAAPFASSYIPTTAASVTRGADSYTASLAATGTTPSIAANVFSLGTGLVAYRNILRFRVAAGDSLAIVDNNTTEDVFVEVDETQSLLRGLSAWPNSRIAGYVDGTNIGICRNGSCSTAAQTSFLSNTAKTLYIGTNNTGSNQANAIITAVCVDPSPTRCR